MLATNYMACKLPSSFQYLTKQAATLKDVNDSRVKIYEQLEVSISDLECTNKKLIDENSSDRVKIKRYIRLLLCSIKLENRYINYFLDKNTRQIKIPSYLLYQ